MKNNKSNKWVLTFLFLLGAGQGFAAHDIVVGVAQRCDGDGQTCFPVVERDVYIPRHGHLDITYYVSTAACSGLEVRFAVDDGPWSEWSEKLGWYIPAAIGKLSTEPVSFGFVRSGNHRVFAQARGRVSGCNHGRLHGWAGKVELDISPR